MEPATAHVVPPKVSNPPADLITMEPSTWRCVPTLSVKKEPTMNRIIYIVGLVVIVIAILSFFGLR